MMNDQLEPIPPRFPKALFFLPLLPLAGLVTYLVLPPTIPASPLAYPSSAPLVRQSLVEPDKQPLIYYLSASGEYLRRARELSNKLGMNQTNADKQEIITLLNQSLLMANNAVVFYPSAPESYAVRAKIFETISVLDPSASEKAQKDKIIATELGENKAPVIPPADLIRYEPIEEASLLNQVAIALPQEDRVGELDGEKEDNAEKGTITIPAGQTQVIVKSSSITPENLVYFTPLGNLLSSILSLTSKTTCEVQEKDCLGSFTLAISQALPHDLAIDWWIVN